jgi:hypothetical protein
VTDAEGSEAPGALPREDIARQRRRQEALDSLEYEQEREAMLRQRLEPLIRDADAWQADETAVAGMSADDVETLRRIGFVQQRPPEDAAGRFEAQIAELEAMIEDSQRRQRAFAAYAEALGS